MDLNPVARFNQEDAGANDMSLEEIIAGSAY